MAKRDGLVIVEVETVVLNTENLIKVFIKEVENYVDVNGKAISLEVSLIIFTV